MITRLPHRKKPGRVIRRFLGWTLMIVLLFVLLISTLINVFFSPEKLSKMVKEYAVENFNAEVDFSYIEMTFIRSFPDMEVRVENANVISKVLSDTLQSPLLSAQYCVLRINPFNLFEKVIKVDKFELDTAKIVLLVDNNGVANWDIFKTSMTTDSIQDDSLSKNRSWRVFLNQVDIRGGEFKFEDKSMDFYTGLNDINISLEGNLLKRNPQLLLDLSATNITVCQKGELLVDSITSNIKSKLRFCIDSLQTRIEYAKCKVNDVNFTTKGIVRKDTAQNASYVDLKFRMHVDSLDSMLEMVPEYILEKEKKPEVTGEVFCRGAMIGWYGHGKYPLITANFRVKEGSIAYPEMPYKIDSLEAKCSSLVDLQKHEQSYLRVDSLYIKGGNSVFNLSGTVNDLLGDVIYQMDMQADVNLDDITKIFPLKNNVVFKGNVKADLRGRARHEDLIHSDYGKVRLGGFLNMDKLNVFIPNDSIVLNVKSLNTEFDVNRKNEDILQGVDAITAKFKYSDLNVSIGRYLSIRTEASSLMAKTSPLYDTTMVASISSEVSMGRTVIVMEDTLLLGIKRLEVTAKLKPSNRDKRVPRIETTAYVDSLRLRAGMNQLAVTKADIELNATRSRRDERIFIPSGEFDFVDMLVFSPHFPLRIEMPGSHIRFDRRKIEFESAHLIAGASDVYITGNINNMWRAFFRQDTVHGDVQLASNRLDCNELIWALEKGRTYVNEMHQKQRFVFSIRTLGNMDSLYISKNQSDTVSMKHVLMLPKRVDFKIGLDVNKVLFDDLDIEDVKGNVCLKNEILKTVDLNMRAAKADIKATVSYCALDSVHAHLGMNVKMEKIQVDSLVTMLSDIDSILPMLHPFAGQVDFGMAAEMTLDSLYNIESKTLNGAAYLDGTDMVLMDNETFKEISKILMLKNKQKNMIDKISVDMVVREGVVEIYPFQVNMDRYSVAVGGKHDIAADFKYHITIFKPQLVASTVGGISIKGNVDKLSYYPTKARYRGLDSLSRREEICKEQEMLKRKIVKFVVSDSIE